MLTAILIHILPAFVSAFILQILIHEFGHLVLGLMTGWKFIYLQIYSIVLEKQDNKFLMKILSTRSFQCIMYPNPAYIGALLYTLGGCIFNLLGAFVGLVIMFLLHDNPVVWLYSWCLFVSGIMICIVNGVPNTKRICNDGACYKLLKSDKLTLKCHNSQLAIAKELSEGKTYHQIGHNSICLVTDAADNDILAYQVILEYYYWLELDEVEKMKQALSKIDMGSSISLNLRNIILMERLYLDLYCRVKNMCTEPMEISKDYGDIHEFIKVHRTKGDIHSIRVRVVLESWELIMKNDIVEALNNIEGAICCINGTDYLYEGEVGFCVEQLRRVEAVIG